MNLNGVLLQEDQNIRNDRVLNLVSIKEEFQEEIDDESGFIYIENPEFSPKGNKQELCMDISMSNLKEETCLVEDITIKNETCDTFEINGEMSLKTELFDELTVELTPDQVKNTVRVISSKCNTSNQKHGEFFCQLCEKNFTRKCGLVSHMLIHEGIKRFQCQVCQKTFIHNYQLTKHARIHSGEQPYGCDICGKRFLHNDVVKHKRVHHYNRENQGGKRSYSCSYCGHVFTRRSALCSHEKVHLGVKDQVCHLCGKAFTLRSGLVRHYRTHSGVKDVSCAKCGKQFSNKTCLRIHNHVHTRERPYKCVECNKTFTQNSALYYHKRIHSGLKPFECNVCHRTFHVKHNLKTHMVRHGGDRKFRCRLCPKAFALAQVCSRHEKTHKKDCTEFCVVCGKGFPNQDKLKLHLKRQCCLNKLKPTTSQQIESKMIKAEELIMGTQSREHIDHQANVKVMLLPRINNKILYQQFGRRNVL